MDLCPRCELRIARVALCEEYNACEERVHSWAAYDASKVNSLLRVRAGLEHLLRHEKDKRIPRICDCCLGVLHIDFLKLASDVKKLSGSKGYQFKGVTRTFCISIIIDPQIYLRQRAAELIYEPDNNTNIVIQTNGACTENNYVIDIKKCFRFIASRYISQVMDSEHDQKSNFTFTCKLTHSDTKNDMILFDNLDKPWMKKFTVGRVPEYIQELEIEHFKKIFPLIHARVPVESKLFVTHAPIYVGGRYFKYRRNISNSKWLYGGERVTMNSVEELLAKRIVEYFGCDNYKFYSSGREDSDALMLGNGRPFYFELINPKIIEKPPKCLKEIENSINKDNSGLVGSVHLAVISEDDADLLRLAASTKNKRYRALIETSRKILPYEMEILSAIKNLPLQQRTPIRVPKRSDIIREKTILDMKIVPAPEKSRDLNLHLLECELSTTAGTYVKEFVSGDEGRTEPSLCSILNCEYAIVRELDVLEVCIDWPKNN